MIEVRYRGNFGNHLFQYCFGRILAEALGYRLVAPAIEGFPGTREAVDGLDHSSLDPQTVTGQRKDLAQMLSDRTPRRLLLHGYFEWYPHFQPYKEAIRNRWLRSAPPDAPGLSGDDLVVHIRRNDVVFPSNIALPMSYYDECLSATTHRDLYVCTDNPKDSFVRAFAEKHGARVRVDTGYLEDFFFMMRFEKIITSASTFSWWASFLSPAKEIYAPVPLNGFWSDRFPSIDLTVTDEERYRYIACRETYQPTRREKIQQVFAYVSRKGLKGLSKGALKRVKRRVGRG